MVVSEGAALHARALPAAGRVRGRLHADRRRERRPAGGAERVSGGTRGALHVPVGRRAPLAPTARPPRDDRHRAQPIPASRVHARARSPGAPRLQRLLVLRPADARGDPARHGRDHDGDSRRLGGARGMKPFAFVVFDGERLSLNPRAPGRRLRMDARCVEGERVRGAFAHVCALTDRSAALRYDEPEVQQARRDALAWWIPMLGDELVCLSTFALDASRCAGAVTVARDRTWFEQDPFARLFPGTTVEADFFCAVVPPPGPPIERYAGAPWPGGRF